MSAAPFEWRPVTVSAGARGAFLLKGTELRPVEGSAVELRSGDVLISRLDGEVRRIEAGSLPAGGSTQASLGFEVPLQVQLLSENEQLRVANLWVEVIDGGLRPGVPGAGFAGELRVQLRERVDSAPYPLPHGVSVSVRSGAATVSPGRPLLLTQLNQPASLQLRGTPPGDSISLSFETVLGDFKLELPVLRPRLVLKVAPGPMGGFDLTTDVKVVGEGAAALKGQVVKLTTTAGLLESAQLELNASGEATTQLISIFPASAELAASGEVFQPAAAVEVQLGWGYAVWTAALFVPVVGVLGVALITGRLRSIDDLSLKDFLSASFPWAAALLTGLFLYESVSRSSANWPIVATVLLLSLIAAVGVIQAWWERRPERLLLANYEYITKKYAIEPTPVTEDEGERLLRAVKQRGLESFARNRQRGLLVESLSTTALPFFGSVTWQLEPRLNVLLGRNGYGKSHLLRLLAVLLARDARAFDGYFGKEESQRAAASLADPAEPEAEVSISRSPAAWGDEVGKVPVLAIGDLRFVDRSRDTVRRQAQADDERLPEGGAYHFIQRQAMGALTEHTLYLLCLDYLGAGRKSEAFELVHEVIAELAGSDFEVVDIRRRNAAAQEFEILVRTEGSALPVRLQQASQGTLSVLAIVLHIYYYLAALYEGRKGEELRASRAVVIIDEVDAHLHPAWQKKILGVLTRAFPCIQFIVSAHSPLVVAGCRPGEVAVLRRDPELKTIEIKRFDKDFIGWEPTEILRVVQEVDPLDEEYLRLRATNASELQEQAKDLRRQSTHPDDMDAQRLAQIELDLERIPVVQQRANVRIERDRLENENQDLKRQLRMQRSAKP